MTLTTLLSGVRFHEKSLCVHTDTEGEFTRGTTSVLLPNRQPQETDISVTR